MRNQSQPEKHSWIAPASLPHLFLHDTGLRSTPQPLERYSHGVPRIDSPSLILPQLRFRLQASRDPAFQDGSNRASERDRAEALFVFASRLAIPFLQCTSGCPSQTI